MHRSLALAVALGSATALAQSVSLGNRSLGDGLLLPPESAATVDDAAAGTLNPAGIGLMQGVQLEYYHEREILSGSNLVGDGLYGAATLFNVLAASLSAEWIRPGASARYTKTHLGLAVAPDRTVSLGLAYNVFGSPDPGVGGLTSWDAGLTWRPFAFLSLAATARDFDNPSVGPFGPHLPRRFDGAVALRPFGNRFTLAADYLVFADGFDPNLNGVGNGRIGVTAELDLPWGFSVLGGASFPLNQASQSISIASTLPSAPQSYGQIGLRLDTEHVGAVASYAPQDPGTPLGLGAATLGLRISAESFSGLPPAAAQVLSIDLAEVIGKRPSGLAALLPSSADDPFEQLLLALAQAAGDFHVQGVLFRLTDLGGLSLARVEELRGAIAALRAHGKEVVAILGGGGDGIYYLASACDRIYAVPATDFELHGFAASSLYFAEGLSKLGVKVDVVRVGPYKSAPDAFTRDAPSPEQTEVTRALLNDAMDRYLAAVSSARGVTAEAFKAVLDRGLSTAEQLKEAGLVDAVLYPDELSKTLGGLLHRPVLFEDVALGKAEHQLAWSNLPGVAVVNVFGTITGGESEDGPLALARTAGAITVCHALEAAADDSSIAAVVVRVDSGGGDGAASELIWRAIKQVRRHKPVVVSFGDMAASGGYYLAVAGDEILAEPSTVTGSIGVFALKPDLSGLAEKLGIHPHQEAVTPNADIFSLATPWTSEERAVVQGYVDSFYGTFVARVAEGRSLPDAAVEAVGRGHVWSGSQAKERGLVDGLGSFLDAVDHAKARAHLSPGTQVRLVTFGASSKSPLNLGALGEMVAQAHGESQVIGMLRGLLQASGAMPALLFSAARPLALPEELPQLH